MLGNDACAPISLIDENATCQFEGLLKFALH